MACSRFYISGRVQGVFFRVSTRDYARALGLTGQVSNLADGRVRVLACGTTQAVQALQDWLWQGPPQARVTDVEREDCAHVPDFKSFDIT